MSRQGSRNTFPDDFHERGSSIRNTSAAAPARALGGATVRKRVDSFATSTRPDGRSTPDDGELWNSPRRAEAVPEAADDVQADQVGIAPGTRRCRGPRQSRRGCPAPRRRARRTATRRVLDSTSPGPGAGDAAIGRGLAQRRFHDAARNHPSHALREHVLRGPGDFHATLTPKYSWKTRFRRSRMSCHGTSASRAAVSAST
jgi:hypothetical protein